MKTIEIKHRWTDAVLYTTEVADDDSNPLRTAVKRAVAAHASLDGAYLARANLADAYLARANLARANLADAYLARANLDGANLDGADLADANLADAYLARANLARANLADAYLARANLDGAYLADANLDGAYLAGANLADANLADADLAPVGSERKDPPEPYVRPTTPEARAERLARRAAEYRAKNPDVPVVEKLDAKILDVIESGKGTLDMSDWHHGDACGTTHCRAGWAIHLAGPAGLALEQKLGSAELAGRAIYRASTGRVPHFFASNQAALADLKRCATGGDQ